MSRYGNIPTIWAGTGIPNCWALICKAFAAPNSNDAAHAPAGVHPPKISAAKAMNPRPLVMSGSNAGTDSNVKYAPPMPAIAPPIITAVYRVRMTLIPAACAARGNSPTDRRRNPHGVWKITRCVIGTSKSATHAMGCCWKTGPTTGKSASTGIRSAGNKPAPTSA